MFKIKCTPLLIAAVICVGLGVWAFINNEPQHDHRSGVGVNWIMPVLLLFVALVAFLADLLFKKLIPETKKIWAIEGAIVAGILLYVI